MDFTSSCLQKWGFVDSGIFGRREGQYLYIFQQSEEFLSFITFVLMSFLFKITQGYQPIHVAAMFEQPKVVEFLLDKGALIEVRIIFFSNKHK